MTIDGLTACVGEEYADYLAYSLPLWLGGLNRLFIVTDIATEPILRRITGPYGERVSLLVTDAFTLYGAHFNKGAALAAAYYALDPQEWVLHFDSDIQPPPAWRSLLPPLRRGTLYGAPRFDGAGESLDAEPIYPYGYFHLWHSQDPSAARWPVFEVWHPHAGHYDAEFADQWPRDHRIALPLRLLHRGNPRSNWFGPGADPAHMAGLHDIGLVEAKEKARLRQGVLGVPRPVRLRLARPELLRVCGEFGIFAVDARTHVRMGERFDRDRHVLRPHITPDQLRSAIRWLMSNGQ